MSKLKSLAEFIPPVPGILLNHIPFSVRLKGYKDFLVKAHWLLKADNAKKEVYILENFNKICLHFILNSNFYKNYLRDNHIGFTKIYNVSEICKIPLLNKAILRNIPLDERTVFSHGIKKYNTGGTSGSPLSFYLERTCYSREWAHMHLLWKKINYHPCKTKITIRGKNINNLYIYNFNQNEFLINSYYPYTKNDYKKLLQVFKKYNTEFLHGYPSSIYNFIKVISIEAPELIEFLRKNIKGIMFGSEFPSPSFRNYIEDTLTKNTISWYGHSEGVVLAGELYQKYEYFPLLSYGYAEAVKIKDSYHLVGTSFTNLASPFIRYDTEDLILPNFNKFGILESFQIKEGRIGEFIIDKNNNNISLTSLIFGRHHKLFDLVDFIQIKQQNPGEIIVYYSSPNKIDDPSDLFDSRNLNLDVLFCQIQEPFRTAIGKVPLLIK